jgi:hypothetical protein
MEFFVLVESNSHYKQLIFLSHIWYHFFQLALLMGYQPTLFVLVRVAHLKAFDFFGCRTVPAPVSEDKNEVWFLMSFILSN